MELFGVIFMIFAGSGIAIAAMIAIGAATRAHEGRRDAAQQAPDRSAIAGSILPLFDPSFTPDPPVAVLTQGFGPGVDRYIPTFPYLGVPKDGYHTPAAVGASNVSGAGAATLPGVVPQH